MGDDSTNTQCLLLLPLLRVGTQCLLPSVTAVLDTNKILVDDALSVHGITLRLMVQCMTDE
jgi:hypothetical protein